MRLRCKIFFTLAGLKFGNSAKGRTVHCCLMVGSFDCVSTESGEVQTLQARRLWVARAHSCNADDMGGTRLDVRRGNSRLCRPLLCRRSVIARPVIRAVLRSFHLMLDTR